MSNQEVKVPRSSRTNWIVLSLNFGAILFLLLSYLTTHFPPTDLGYFSLCGLAYPIILAVNVLFILYWIVKKKRYALFSLIGILSGLNHFTDFFQISFSHNLPDGKESIKVMTYNVRLFDLYNQKGGKTTRNKIFDVLDREDADIICFQEFFHSEKKGYFTTKDTLLQFLPNKYMHERYTHALNGQQYFGVALFSKYPIIKRGHVPFSNDPNNFCIYADFVKGVDTIRIYNAHLQSIRFKPEDYALVDGNKNKEELDQGSVRIARRLKQAFVKRQEQVERLVESISQCRHEVILCGDFNDPPVSYTYGKLTETLEDSFLECGNGIGNTYIGVFPSYRIDYIMHSRGLETIGFKTLPEKLSDHHAVTAVLRIKQNAD